MKCMNIDCGLQSNAVERAGPKVVFVNYDKYIGSFGGRFCEAGVDESTVESTTRWARPSIHFEAHTDLILSL